MKWYRRAGDSTNSFTRGKVYEFKDGYMINDQGNNHTVSEHLRIRKKYWQECQEGVCDPMIGTWIVRSFSLGKRITKGKAYQILKKEERTYTIIGDNGASYYLLDKYVGAGQVWKVCENQQHHNTIQRWKDEEGQKAPQDPEDWRDHAIAEGLHMGLAQISKFAPSWPLSHMNLTNQPTNKETKMRTIEDVTQIDGTNSNHFDKAELIEMIRNDEAEIETLRKIQVQSTAIDKMVKGLLNNIDKMVKLLDKRKD